MAMGTDQHLSHDPYVIAQLAGGDLAGAELAAARRTVETCPECAELFADLASIAMATAQVPAPVRSHDFRLTHADAARLRSPWRRWLGGLAQPRFAFTQPLGAALATLGLAGLLIGVLPNLAVSSGASTGAGAPAPVAGREMTAAPVAPPAGPASEPSSSDGSSEAVPAATGEKSVPAGTPDASGPSGAMALNPATEAPSPPSIQAAAPPDTAPDASDDPGGYTSLGQDGSPIAPDASNAAPAASDGGTGGQPAPSDALVAPEQSGSTGGAAADAAPTDAGARITTGIAPAPEGSNLSVGDSETNGPSALAPGSIVLLLAGVVILLARRSAVRVGR